MQNLTDEEIVEIVRSKNPEAYSEIVSRYQQKLTRYAAYLTRDTNLADDVVQCAFLKAYENLNGFNIERKFSSWIYRIVHNEALNKIKREQRLLNIEGFEEIFESKTKIEKDFEKEEAKEILKQNLDKLNIKYKEPLVLFYLEDKNYEEISDILQLPLGTVGTRINRAKIKLREIYDGPKLK